MMYFKSKYNETHTSVYGGWRKYEKNPVILPHWGETFDPSINKLPDRYRLYYSWRQVRSIACSDSFDGFHWTKPILCLPYDLSTGFEEEVNRQTVVYKNGKFQMWYNGQVLGHLGMGDGLSVLMYAESNDGIHWEKKSEPVLRGIDNTWECGNILCPHINWDNELQKYRMWYSAGEFYDPILIGYAESSDGFNWERNPNNPIFKPIYENLHERERVGGSAVVKDPDGWHYMFYISYEDAHKSTISIARSLDGITNWERHPENPIIATGPSDSWDSEAIFKPCVLHEKGRWLLWYNGGNVGVEHIGMAIHDGDDLGFEH
jgi:predicted GH43/DUF377 family glycosyl hydrolase